MTLTRLLAAARRRRTPRTGLVALLAVFAVALAGCAGSAGSSAQAGSDGRIKLNMMSTSATFTDLPTAVILARDYFTQVGLDVKFDYGASNASLITQAVIAGDADVATSGAGSVYNAYVEGRTNLVSLGTTNPSITFGLALNQQTIDKLAATGVTPQSPAHDRVQALRGLNITASPQGSTGNSYLRLMLTTYGVDPDRDLTILPNNDGTAQIATTRQGRADGFAQSFPRSNFPEAEGWGAMWLNWAVDLPDILPLAAQDYYTTRGWLQKNPEAAKRLMQAVWLAQRDLQNPTTELRDAVKKLPGFADLDTAAYNAGWELAVAAYKGATPLTSPEMFDNEVSLVNASRAAPVQLKFDDIYDLSAARAAQPAQ